MKKRVLVRGLAFLIIFALTTLATGGSALAGSIGYDYFYDHQYVNYGGVHSCSSFTYFIDTTTMPYNLASYYAGTIESAVNMWVTKTNGKVGMSRTYSSTGATIVFKLKTSLPNGARGITYFYDKYGAQVSPLSQNWTYCKVDLVSNLWSYGIDQAKRTICHEAGHCLGLDHPNLGYVSYVKDSIMWQYDQVAPGLDQYKALEPCTNDIANINKIYP